jgi:hypothetical protein
MATAIAGIGRPKSIARAAQWDALFVALAGVHAVVLSAWPSIPAIALGLWWNSNTIAHNFIHRPFFRSRLANACFSAYLSVLLGIPQTLWRERHLAHHAEASWKLRISARLLMETAVVLASWAVIAFMNPAFFAQVYVPGYLVGLALCWMQGHFEHERGITSHYGRFYNLLLFNDGYHAEHHAHPGLHWTELPDGRAPDARESRWPAPLRWLDALSLEGLERLALRWPWLQARVLASHRRVLRAVLPRVQRVVIVGGGLFPRTALLLRELLPEARLTIMDANLANLDCARTLLDVHVEFVHCRYTPGDALQCDLLVIPLSFQGDRPALYRQPPAPAVLIHDWIWRKRGSSRIVSLALFKRVNLITP